MLRLKLRLLKDNISLYVIMILMSILLAGVFGSAFGGDSKGTIYVEDVTKSVKNSDLINSLKKEKGYNISLVTYEEGIKHISEREGLMFIQFSDQIKIFELKPTVERYQVERVLESAMSAQNELDQYSEKVYQIIAESSEGDVNKTELLATLKTKVKSYEESKGVFSLERQVFESDALLYYNPKIHSMLGMTLFFVTYSLLFTVGDYLEDRRLHTLDRMMVSPASRFKILSANIIPAFLIGTYQIVIMILSGKYLFGIKWGEQIGGIILIGMMYIFTMTALSFFIVSLVKNLSQLSAVSPIILTGMGMIGGCMWPLEIISSKVLLGMANLTPHKWAISGIESIMVSGYATKEVFLTLGILFSMGVFYLILTERVLAYKISD